MHQPKALAVKAPTVVQEVKAPEMAKGGAVSFNDSRPETLRATQLQKMADAHTSKFTYHTNTESIDSSKVAQLQLAAGQYGLKNKVFKTTVRNDDPPNYTKLGKLPAGSQVTVMDKGDRVSNFKGGLFKTNEHSWTQSDLGTGWIEDSMLVGQNEGAGPSGLTLHNPMMDAFLNKPATPPAARWSQDETLVELFYKETGLTAYHRDADLGSIQFSITADAIKIGGIQTVEGYPGVGSVMLQSLLADHIKDTVQVSGIVGSHGYWARLGLDIPEAFIHSREDIERVMEQRLISKRDAIDALTRDATLRHRGGVGNKEIAFRIFMRNVTKVAAQKGWRQI